MIQKKRFTNFSRTISEPVAEEPLLARTPSFEAAQFSIATKSAEIKAYLKKLQKQLETFPNDSENERFTLLREALTMLEKHLKKPMVISFLTYTLLREIQTFQKSQNYLTHRIILTNKLSEIIGRVEPHRIDSLIKILMSLVLHEKENKVKAALIKSLIKLYKKAAQNGQQISIKESIFQDFMALYPTLGLEGSANKRAIKLAMQMIIDDKEKLQAFANLLFQEAQRTPSLIVYFIKLIRKVGIDTFKDDMVRLWTEVMLDLMLTSKQIEEIQIDVLDFFSEVFSKDAVKDLREDIFNFYCESARSFDRKIKNKGAEVIGRVTTIQEETLIKALKKEELEHYKRKKKTKKDEISTSDVSITAETSRALALNRVTGTFIYLLEDEYADIRVTTIHSLRNLAERFGVFAKEARDILFYMLHDESDLVRVAALEALSKVLQEISLGAFEKDMLLFNIKEEVFSLRVGIYKLLKIIKAADEEILQQLMNGLSENLDAFVEDKKYIFDSLRALVLNNKALVEAYMNNLLMQEEKYLVQEPDWKSSRHIGKMILMVTAASILPNLAPHYPYYYEKHLSYLSDIYPEYFRDGKKMKKADAKKQEARAAQTSTIMTSIPMNRFRIEDVMLQEMRGCFSAKTPVEQQVKTLKKMEESFNSLFRGKDVKQDFLHKLLMIVQTHFKLRSDMKNAYSLQAIFSKWNDSSLYDIFVQIIGITETFKIKDAEFLKLLSRLKLHVLFFCLAKLINTSLVTKTTYQKKILEVGLFILNDFNHKSLLGDQFESFQELYSALEDMVRNPANILKPAVLTNVNKGIVEFLKNFTIQCEKIDTDKILEAPTLRAEVLEPHTNLEDSVEFHAQLFVKFNVIADIYNAAGIEGLCIGVKSQDQKTSMFKVTQNDVILDDSQAGLLKIRSTVHLDYGHWNRPSMIEMFVAKLLEPENGQLVHLLENHTFTSEVDNVLSGKFFVISNKVKLMIKPIH